MKNNYYKLTGKEIFINLSIICAILFFIAKLFYGTFLMGIIILPTLIPIMKTRKKQIIIKKKFQLELEFKDMLISLADGVNTGYSVENAIKESYKEMLMVYGYNSSICKELRIMTSQIQLNISTEKVIENFAIKTNLDNAKIFSEVFAVAKRTGGDMSEVITNTANNIAVKYGVQEEIKVAVREKTIEQKIMTIIPAFLICYVTIASPSFLEIMYKTWMGRLIMTACLMIYSLAYIWSEKIINNISY